jgi:hypothetical protein
MNMASPDNDNEDLGDAERRQEPDEPSDQEGPNMDPQSGSNPNIVNKLR